jgi:hypothetical protein
MDRSPLFLCERDEPLGKIVGPLKLAPHQMEVPQSS